MTNQYVHPAIFQGRRDGRTDWYIVDPSTDPAKAATKFQALYEAEPRTGWQTFLHYSAGWGTFAGILASSVAVVIALQAAGVDPTLLPIIGPLVVITALGGGVMLGPLVASSVFPTFPSSAPIPSEIIRMDPALAQWWQPGRAIADAWALAGQMERMNALASPAIFNALVRSPNWIEDVLSSALTEPWLEERARLGALGAELGFDVPFYYSDPSVDPLMWKLNE